MPKTRLSKTLKLGFYLPNSLKLLVSSQCVGTAANLGMNPRVWMWPWGQGGFPAGLDDPRGVFLRKPFPGAVITPGAAAVGQEHSALARTDPSAEQSSSQILLKGNEELDAATSCAAHLACSLSLSPGQGKSCSQAVCAELGHAKSILWTLPNCRASCKSKPGGFSWIAQDIGW